MCSIWGAIGYNFSLSNHLHELALLQANAGDRGRDGGRYREYILRHSRNAILGNWRATPTPEIEKAPFQPIDGIVFNGTISNDKELGIRDGEVDTEVLPRILDRSSLSAFASSLHKVKGSYALAVATRDTVFLACNYKPLYYWRDPDGNAYFSSMERHFKGIVSKWERPQKLRPYSVMDLLTGEIQDLPRTYEKKAVVIASAGLDSTVAATKLIRDGWEVHLLHFNYNCKAQEQEGSRIIQIAIKLKCKQTTVNLDMSSLGVHSTITDGKDEDIGGGEAGSEYAIDWVPARNLVMLSLATAFAEANGYHAVALGNNLEESGSYPDNEEEFTHLFDGLLPNAVQNGYKINVLSPVGTLTKKEIVKLGLEIQAPLELTWSCYRSGDIPCDSCGPCYMRKTAFKRNKMKDPVFISTWEDSYWNGCKPYASTK